MATHGVAEQVYFKENCINVINKLKIDNKFDAIVNNVKQVNTATSQNSQKRIDVRMRCAIYIRVSTTKEEQKASLQYQKDLFYRYVQEQCWDIYNIYIDAQTGTTVMRKNLQKLIQDAREKKFDIIVAKELSRLARNGELLYQIKNLCENQGIHIITLDNAINTLTEKRKYINMLAEEIITQEEYRENVEANNIEINELVEKKNDLLSSLEGEHTVDDIEKLKQEFLQFLNFDELTSEILHRLINRIEVKAYGTPVIPIAFLLQ
ncbi:recombinase family protein [Bacillus sp. FJAT-29937]|uniref:recombinase family protein n=1 Tax=Bacillus sp. FJAT-29937 TaxID=1720553 RepID=UPI00082A051F|nr:recombinase family protein [Bacillus sp. FJAT-29937]